MLLLQHAADPLVKDSKCAAALHISTTPPLTQCTAFDYAALIMIMQWQDFCRHCIGEAAWRAGRVDARAWHPLSAEASKIRES